MINDRVNFIKAARSEKLECWKHISTYMLWVTILLTLGCCIAAVTLLLASAKERGIEEQRTAVGLSANFSARLSKDNEKRSKIVEASNWSQAVRDAGNQWTVLMY